MLLPTWTMLVLLVAAEPPPRTPGAIRIATYNVLNLFDHVDDPALVAPHDDMALAVSDERCRNLAAAIIAIDADVLALQEIESRDALVWFRDKYLPDAGYDHVASIDVGYFRGVECSVLSRFEITDTEVWPGASLDDVERQGIGWAPVPAEKSLTFRRSPLRVDVRVNDDYELTIFCLHHKASRDFEYQREAEALRIIELIEDAEAADPSRNIVVLGDFNAAPWDKSVRVYREAGLVDVQSHRTVRGPEGATYKTHESDRVLDYILMNAAAYRECVPGSVFVHATVLPPPDYDWRSDPHPPGYASDHYPVVVDLVPCDAR